MDKNPIDSFLIVNGKYFTMTADRHFKKDSILAGIISYFILSGLLAILYDCTTELTTIQQRRCFMICAKTSALFREIICLIFFLDIFYYPVVIKYLI